MNRVYPYLASGVSILGVLLPGCRKARYEPEEYRVINYDSRTHQWTLIRTGSFSDGASQPPRFMRKRMLLVCNSYQWGHREPVYGPDACNFNVGRLYSLNLQKGSYLLPDETSNDTFTIIEGWGPDAVMQQFTVLRNELLP